MTFSSDRVAAALKKCFIFVFSGISEVKTNVQSHSTDHEGVTEVVLSCSATGKPVPVIEWAFSAGASVLTEHQTTTAANSDHTFTSSQNISLQVPAGWKGHVDCLLNSEVMEQQRKQIPFTVAPEKEEKKGMYSSNFIWECLLCVV